MKTLLTILFIMPVSFTVYAQPSDSFLSFDGNDDIVIIPTNTAYNLGIDNFTIEAMIRSTDFAGTNSDENIFGTSQPTYNCTPPCSNGFSLGLLDGKPTFFMELNYIGSGGGIMAYSQPDSIDLRDGLCHHIAASAQYYAGADTGRIISIYVDGILKKTTNSFPKFDINPGALPLYIGSLSNSWEMKGMVKEVRLWRTLRTQSQIQVNINTVLPSSDPNLIGYWRCNDGTGTAVHDYSMTANNGSLGNGTVSTYPAWTTLCCGAGCMYPSNTHVTNLTSTSAKLNWTIQDCSNGYRLQYRLKGTTAWTTLNPTQNQSMRTITGLTPGSKYQWHIRTKCGITPALFSGYSPIQTFTVPLRLADGDANDSLSIAVSLYPNPFSTSSVIKLNRDGNYEFNLFDVYGRIVLTASFSGKEYEIQRGRLAPGVYYIRLSENRQVIFQGKLKIE